MPAVPAPAKVLVTGASGFIASHVVQTLLGEGYTVVGTGKLSITLLWHAYNASNCLLGELERTHLPDRFC